MIGQGLRSNPKGLSLTDYLGRHIIPAGWKNGRLWSWHLRRGFPPAVAAVAIRSPTSQKISL